MERHYDQICYSAGCNNHATDVYRGTKLITVKKTKLNYRSWTTNMWHFGIDTIDEYRGKEFEVTFEEGMSDLYRIYTKRMKDGKNIVRTEHQENPNQPIADALVKKLFPDGRLVVQEEGSE